MRRRSFLKLAAAGAVAGTGGRVVAAPPRPAAAVPGAAQARQQARAAMDRGVAYLRKTQQEDGSWLHYPGITALDLIALVRAGVAASDPAASRAAAFLAAQAKPNGGIYDDSNPAQALPNYNTSLSVSALVALGGTKYRTVVQKAQRFLENSQFDEAEGFTPRQYQYGGIGYGSKADNPDLSNLQQALEALRDSGYPQHGPAFERAIQFLQRCQNRKESNDQSWSGNDGGFIYAASGESKADEYTKQPHSSYGSMTYAGLKSYLYCGLTRNDPRAKAAYQWLQANYSVEENSRMKDDGLYYYYHTMSKTLAVYGDKTFVDAKGTRHYWAVELIGALARRQKPDGSWVNTTPRWRENTPDLTTAYAVISLANCLKGL